ncbi:lanthionine synthetase C family protein [Streptomyces abikoensis]|uniref:Lanthionine synthetase C family protein n=1 Tax=Streptomyces abikoensis TaxID=97398 RepID=A0ABW7T4T8_9ACTN
MQVSDTIAEHLADPAPDSASGPWWRQSLAHGAPGIALLHIERAAAGRGPWERAHQWLTYAAGAPVTSGPDSHLYYGAPAIAHALACASTARPTAYRRGLEALDRTIAADATRRAAQGHARIDHGALPVLAEFDVIRGLAGVGSYLLRRDPDGDAVRAVLEYLVRLTDPLVCDGATLPGWWTATGPSGRGSEQFPGGHGNAGLAHGIGGPLALLALAARRGVTVEGQVEAIGAICRWFDQWLSDAGAGPLWPYWVTRPQLRARTWTPSGRQRPSWCYGAVGLARVQQLAALATGDTGRQDVAERAAIAALSSCTAVSDRSLCHGHAGLAHLAAVIAADASPQAAARLRELIPGLVDTTVLPGPDFGEAGEALVKTAGPGFLEGAAGTALALLTHVTGAPLTGWDACLLIR